jgi:arylformamidase
MLPEKYPPQEPLSGNGLAYHQRVMAMGAGVEGCDARYGDDPYQGLTVFQAKTPNGSVLVFFHGGGWTSGYKEWMAFMAPALNAQGITFVIAGYRLAPEHIFPVGFDDCADAMSWVWNNISRFGGDPNRVFAGGHSAGGHYASLLSVTHDWRDQRKLPAMIRGCLPVSGVYRFGEASGMALRPRFLGPATNDNELAASPELRLTFPLCPFLIAYGERDFPHLRLQAEQMCDALKRNHCHVEKLILHDCDHFSASIALGELDGAWVRSAVGWMAKVVNSPA